jgi:hypothetical protein
MGRNRSLAPLRASAARKVLLADEVDGFFRMLQQELGPQITLTEAEQQHVE